ncbi:MAG TPA: iron-containing alcohol dehydrogenase [Spirochaetia bacterium]|nr:iron-containing alcohol dehydrogenase [Spirochaetia bacterium]
MLPFSLEAPRAIHFGAGAIEKLGGIAAASGGRALLVTGSRSLAAAPWIGQIETLLSGLTLRRLICPPGEPSTSSLAHAMEDAASFAPDLLVAVGGGSVLDTAKALSALLRYGGPSERFLEGVPGSVPVPGPCIPWVAVPTTAGTGAEVTKNSVVRAESLGVKRSMRSAFLLAHAVIVDPRLTLTLPLSVTGTSGLDALTQLVEAYVTKKSNPYVRSIVEGAFGPMLDALQALPRDLADLEQRTRASYGALVSGVALANAGLGAAHGFAAGIGGLFEVPHGLVCAVMLPSVLEANEEVAGPDLERLAASCGDVVPSHATAASWLAGRVRELLDAFGLPRDLRGFHIPAERIREIAEKSSGSSMNGNPRELGMAEREQMLARII